MLDAARIDRRGHRRHRRQLAPHSRFCARIANASPKLALVGGHAAAETAALIPDATVGAAAERDGIAPVIDAYLPRYFSPHFYDDAPEMIERARSIMQQLSPRAAAALIRAMRDRPSSDDLLDSIDVPALVIAAPTTRGLHRNRFGVRRPVCMRASNVTNDADTCR